MPKLSNTNILKKQILVALEKSLGIVTTACKNVGIARVTFYEWLKKDEKFRMSVEKIEDIVLDFAESQLHKKISEGDTASIIVYLKTKGKQRGYIERQEFKHSFDPVKEIEIKENYYEIKPSNNKDIQKKQRK